MSLRVDGDTVARLTADKDPPGFPGVGYTIGQGGHAVGGKRSRFYRGRVAEIMVYDRPVDAVEMLRVEEYLSDKYHLVREHAPSTQGLALWLSADSLSAAEEGSPVEQWVDQSGQGRVGSQSDAARRPQYLPHGINRRPALDFGRADAQLDFSGWRPSIDGSAYAAIRSTPHQRGDVVQHAPPIDPRWGGRAERFAGAVSELLVYDRRLSSDEAESVECYLRGRYSEPADPRYFPNGTLIFRNGYSDQPYVVKCRDGSWLCVITTSAHSEGSADRTLVVTRSRDQGRTWSEAAYSIEPREMRQPSWATLYVAPYGRVYVFYNLRTQPVRQRARVDFVFKYSDDHGETWSRERFSMPLRELHIDDQVAGTGGWSVCPPIEIDGEVLLSCTRFTPPKRSGGRGFIFRSDNLRSERDPAKIHWEMLPTDDRGIRYEPAESSMQEEHIITPLTDGGLFCIWRTTSGYACHSFSRDRGRTWIDPGFATYTPDGRRIKQPLACCRPFRTSEGRYLLWFHNTKPLSPGAVYRPRDVVWLAGGEDRDGVIHWSQPEVLLYGLDLPVRGLGMSYPDFIEEGGRRWVTTTDKEGARIFEIDPSLLDGLWNQKTRRDPPTDGLVLDMDQEALRKNASPAMPPLPSLLHGGFTVDLTCRLDELRPDLTLLEGRSQAGAGWAVTTADRGALRIKLDDGRHTPEGWVTDSGLLETGRTHQVTFIVDGGPNLILVLVDGILCDGGEQGQRGWGRFSRRLMQLAGPSARLSVAPTAPGAIQRLRLYTRPLRVSEGAALHRFGASDYRE